MTNGDNTDFRHELVRSSWWLELYISTLSVESLGPGGRGVLVNNKGIISCDKKVVKLDNCVTDGEEETRSPEGPRVWMSDVCMWKRGNLKSVVVCIDSFRCLKCHSDILKIFYCYFELYKWERFGPFFWCNPT